MNRSSSDPPCSNSSIARDLAQNTRRNTNQIQKTCRHKENKNSSAKEETKETKLTWGDDREDDGILRTVTGKERSEMRTKKKKNSHKKRSSGK